METKRIDLGDGDWWDYLPVITRGMRKKLRAASLLAFNLGGDAVDLTDEDSAAEYLRANISKMDPDAVEDALLMVGTYAFSVGSVKLKKSTNLTIEMIDALPDDKVARALEGIRDAYVPNVENAEVAAALEESEKN
jgi:hypothetical protein